MAIDRFRHTDIEPFLALAVLEGWICDRWELEFLIPACPAGCLVWRDGSRPVAFVTAIAYGRSGWIGNLIVSPLLRGRGTGSTLMRSALAALEAAGAETVWLTASAEGRPIYEKLGFRAIDTVHRWRGTGPGAPPSTLPVHDPDTVSSIDRAGWGDCRERIFSALEVRAAFFTEADGFLCRHRYADGIQLGPWGSMTPCAARSLLERVLEPGGTERTFLDVPAGNRDAARLVDLSGFEVSGSTLLMFRGDRPVYRPGLIYALASMGSFG